MVRSPKSKRQLFVLIGLAGATFVAVLLVAGILRDPNAQQRAGLEAEFDGLYAASTNRGDIVEVQLVADEATINLVEPIQTNVWAYNKTVPGPPIQMALGQTLRATVRNDLPQPTTVHWHGVRVPNNMDGVPDINQSPIQPGETFVYEFTPPDIGTYWYHSHTNGSEQLERGLYGTLIVNGTGTQRRYYQDVTWVLDDWLLDTDNQIDPRFNTSQDRSQNGRWGNLITVNSSSAETLETRPGELIRLRLVNASNGRVYRPNFGQLKAQLIAVDGQSAREPVDYEEFKLAPGNRLDVELTTPTTPGSYTISDTYLGAQTPLATITVDGPSESSTETDRPTAKIPEWEAALDMPVDHELVFQTENVNGQWIWTINNATYPEHTPIEIPHGRFVKVRLINQTHPIHPIHLHGQFFKVLTRNGQPVSEPHLRDTVLLEMSDTIEIGFVAADKGQWLLHCHIQEHAEAGMMTTINVT